MSGIYIQYGCGLSCPEGWLNFDASPRLRVERLPLASMLLNATGAALFPKNVKYGDIVKGLPVKDGCATGVYCSHVLEHIDRHSAIIALKNTYKMLEPGGIFRIVVPDLSSRVNRYIQSNRIKSEDAADTFMRECFLGQEFPALGFMKILRRLFGNSDHLWMYDENSLRTLLCESGFINIRRCQFGDANDRCFSLVENEERFFDNGFSELAMEAQKGTAGYALLP